MELCTAIQAAADRAWVEGAERGACTGCGPGLSSWSAVVRETALSDLVSGEEGIVKGPLWPQGEVLMPTSVTSCWTVRLYSLPPQGPWNPPVRLTCSRRRAGILFGETG